MTRYGWLVACLLLGCEGSDDERPALTREELLDPQNCKDCHPKHYAEWSASMHAYATKDPVFQAMNRRGQEETGSDLGPFCVNCHAPMAVREHAIDDFADLSDVPQHLQGVTCYFCHNAIDVGPDHANGDILLANDNVMRAALARPAPRAPTAHGVSYSKNHDARRVQSSILCGSCHDIHMPNGVHLERTLEEYETSIFAQDKPSVFQSCQDCHMNSSDHTLPAATQTGRRGEDVTARNVHEHLWAAVDVALTPDNPYDAQLRAAVDLCELPGANTFSLSAFNVERRFAPGFSFRVLLETTAGHAMPSGAAQDRRMWLEVRAYDAEGRELWQDGVVADDEPEQRPERPHPCLLRDRFVGADGKEAHMFWDAVARDPETPRLIPPPSSNIALSHTFTCTFDGKILEPARMLMRVRMRPMSFDVLQDLIDSGHLEPEILSHMPTFTVDEREFFYSRETGGLTSNPLKSPDCAVHRCFFDPGGHECESSEPSSAPVEP